MSKELCFGEAPLESESDADMKLDPEENDPAKDSDDLLSSILEVGQGLDWFVSLSFCSKVSSSKVTHFFKSLEAMLLFMMCLLLTEHN